MFGNLKDRLIRPNNNVVWDFMSGNIGIKTSNGIVTVSLGDVTEIKLDDGSVLKNAESAQVSVNVFDEMNIPLPAFAMATAPENIELGDMIYATTASNAIGWVVKKEGIKFEILKMDGTRSRWSPPKVNLLGMGGDIGTLVLKSLISITGKDGFEGMKSNMLPFMMMGMFDGSNNPKMENYMKMMLMMNMMGNSTGTPVNNMMSNPMMLMMLMGGDNPLSNMAKSNKFFS